MSEDGTLSWGYAVSNTIGPSSVATAADSSTLYGPEQTQALMGQFAALPPEEQQKLFGAMQANGISGEQQVAAYLNGVFNQLSAGAQTAGYTAMGATATGMELANANQIFEQSQNAGRTSIAAEDVARVVERAEAMATQMMAAGASDKEILKEVGKLSGNNADIAAIVEAKVQQQLDADKFNMTSTRNQEPQTQQAGLGGGIASALFGGGQEEQSQNPFAITAPQPQQVSPFASVSLTSVALAGNTEFPFADLGSTTAALANNEFRPLDTPNLARGQELGRFA